jgi:hypothetical protein
VTGSNGSLFGNMTIRSNDSSHSRKGSCRIRGTRLAGVEQPERKAVDFNPSIRLRAMRAAAGAPQIGTNGLGLFCEDAESSVCINYPLSQHLFV